MIAVARPPKAKDSNRQEDTPRGHLSQLPGEGKRPAKSDSQSINSHTDRQQSSPLSGQSQRICISVMEESLAGNLAGQAALAKPWSVRNELLRAGGFLFFLLVQGSSVVRDPQAASSRCIVPC